MGRVLPLAAMTTRCGCGKQYSAIRIASKVFSDPEGYSHSQKSATADQSFAVALLLYSVLARLPVSCEDRVARLADAPQAVGESCVDRRRAIPEEHHPLSAPGAPRSELARAGRQLWRVARMAYLLPSPVHVMPG